MKSTTKWKLAQQLEIRWWKNYLGKKNPTDYIAWKKAYWTQFLSQLSAHLPQFQHLNILDAGCGPAGINLVLEGNQVDALDPLLDKYKELPHFQPEATPWVHFLHQPLETLNASDKYDLIFCLNAINHVSDLPLCYTNLVKSLKPGGKIVVSTDAHNHSILKHLFRLIPGDALHPHQYDLKEYESFLAENGIQITETLTFDKGFIFNYVVTVGEKVNS